ncbi:MAG TPA: M20 family metallopeptidase [Blastocatellia bacterium]|nr:M20 family metallopeptidase [Blastocatellia bacterium]
MTAEANSAGNLVRYFHDHASEMLEFVRRLVEHESMTGCAEAVTRLSESLASRFSELGGAIEVVSEGTYGSAFLARFSGDGNEDGGLLIVGHLDTVWPLGTLASRPFRVDGDRAFGPGIFDMKAGVALAIFAMKALKDCNKRLRRPVTVLMTCDEESGSPVSRSIVEAEARRARAGLVLEPPIPGGALKTSRKGVAELELVVRGRSAHAGNNPAAGINAITELAHQVLAIDALNDTKRGTTVNVGVVRGGVLQNVIPAEARASIDLRFATIEEGERVIRAIGALQPVLRDARLEVHGTVNRPPMVRTTETGLLFEHARHLASELGFELKEGAVGGGSDGNFIAALGVPVLDGLGVDGADAHAESEYIIISDLPRRAALLSKLIETL